jgi:hypothetical protein
MGTIRVTRSADETTTQTFYLYGRTGQVSSAQLADGSFDSTGTSGTSFITQVLCDSESNGFEYRNTGYAYCLVVSSAPVIRRSVINYNSTTASPVQVTWGSGAPTLTVNPVAISSMPTVSIGTSLSVAGTLPVDPIAFLDLTPADGRFFLAALCLLGGGLLGYRLA